MKKELFVSIVLGLALCAVGCSGSESPVSAAGQEASLTGVVSSEAEGNMEGVLVSAKLDGGTITVTVISNKEGRFAFPKGRLKPGTHKLAIRATGYELPGAVMANVTVNGTTEIDLKLQKVRDLAAQMTNAEWFMSWEGTKEQPGPGARLELLDSSRCLMCHSISFATKNGRSAHEWVPTLHRMRYHTMGSTPLNPDYHPYAPELKKYWGPDGGGSTEIWGEEGMEDVAVPDNIKEQASWLSTVNLSADPTGTWKYPLRTNPRPTGEETNVIITEYDLPRAVSQPHDAVPDEDGMIWYQDFGHNDTGHFISRLDPRTGQVKEWRTAAVRPNPPFTLGGNDVRIDKDGNIWLALLKQGAIAKFDKRTEQMTYWSVPKPTLRSLVPFLTFSHDGNTVWFEETGNGTQIHGLDLKTGWVTKTLKAAPQYSFAAIPNGNIVQFGFGSSAIHELDTKTGNITSYPTPTKGSYPRRGNTDAQGRVWFGEYQGGKIGMFDPATKEIKEWPMPTPYADPYDVIVDRNGTAWSGGMATDYVFRLDPATGKVIKYLLPTVNANIRRVTVDDRTSPVSVWVGETHHAKVARIEVPGTR